MGQMGAAGPEEQNKEVVAYRQLRLQTTGGLGRTHLDGSTDRLQSQCLSGKHR